ncbi:MAG: fasciclin domain-containing protein [Flavobacteriaceae bacterium]|nr:fasciclin domain-containing protein [Flavobacteriaceae bacterium]
MIINKFLNPTKLLLLAVAIAFSACSDDDDNTTPTPDPLNIVETAQATEDLSSLVAALQAADGDLVNVLSGGEFTVLAPTNAAFDNFLADNGFANLSEVPTDVLANILLNHVISGTVLSTTLTDAGAGYTTTNATNEDGDNLSLYFNTTTGVTFNGTSSVAQADVEATNGVVHIVDQVIGLPTIATFATADPTFETLVAALTRPDLEVPFVTILSTTDPTYGIPLTTFAPTNEAFGDLLVEIGADDLSQIDVNLLTAVLLTHVVAQANVRAEDLAQDLPVVTLSEETLTVDLTNGAQLVDPNGRVANIIANNVQAINGVVHVIDKVVLPLL